MHTSSTRNMDSINSFSIARSLRSCPCCQSWASPISPAGRNTSQGHRSLIQHFLTPTFAPWPKNYAALMPHSTCARSRIIRVQVFLLLANICDGDIELRDDLDLADIFCRRFQACGWFIHLSVNLTLRLSVVKWICLSRMPTLTVRSILFWVLFL